MFETEMLISLVSKNYVWLKDSILDFFAGIEKSLVKTVDLCCSSFQNYVTCFWLTRNSLSECSIVWNDKFSLVFSCNNCRWLLRFVVLGRRNLFSRSMGNGTVKWWPSGQIPVELKCLLTLTKWPFPTNFAKKSTNNSVMSREGNLILQNFVKK